MHRIIALSALLVVSWTAETFAKVPPTSCEFLVDGRFDYTDLGFYRVSTSAPPVSVANPEINADRLLAGALQAARDNSSVFLSSELALTGYTAGDMLHNEGVLRRTRQGLKKLLLASAQPELRHLTMIIGLPYQTPGGKLYNVAVVINNGEIQGMVPKTYLPNYREFEEDRWFSSGANVDEIIDDYEFGKFRLATTQIFAIGEMTFAIEICEDLFAPHTPSADHAVNGAQVIFNLSGSNELIGKADFRRELIQQKSASLNAAYIYASSGPTESAKGIVLGGHHLIYESGVKVIESERFQLEGSQLTMEIDIRKIQHERRVNTTFGKSLAANNPKYGPVKRIDVAPSPIPNLLRSFPRNPFVPDDPKEFDELALETLKIQATGLASELKAFGIKEIVIGVSGGLDSTWALLVAIETAKILNWPLSSILAVTLPSTGTSAATLASAHGLARALELPNFREIDIREIVKLRLQKLGHDGVTEDLLFENTTARERTHILLDLGYVIGTGTMSELWKGWCTFNGDQQSSYNVNCSVPKTSVSALVAWYARTRATPELATELQTILSRKPSPELKSPGADGEIAQVTEDNVGPYVLTDWFLKFHLRDGFSELKILELSWLVFSDQYEPAEIAHWLKDFYKRGFTNQFKRSDSPTGPKTGNVSLDPRGDLRIPNGLDPRPILRSIDEHFQNRTGQDLHSFEAERYKDGPIQ